MPNQKGPIRRQLKIDLADLEFAFEESSWEAVWYLDLDTGNVLRIADETRTELDALYAEVSDAEEQGMVEIAAVLQDRDLPQWRKEALADADLMQAGNGSRFIQVPQADTRQDYEDIEEFISTLHDERLREQLSRAIRGRGAFGRFRDMLAEVPEERERWFAFKAGRVRARVLDWLASEGIDPIANPGE